MLVGGLLALLGRQAEKLKVTSVSNGHCHDGEGR